jgi:hypothetical protein
MVYIRYHHVRLIISKDNNHFNLRKTNTIAYIIGLLACFGVSVVGNFQVIILKKLNKAQKIAKHWKNFKIFLSLSKQYEVLCTAKDNRQSY